MATFELIRRECSFPGCRRPVDARRHPEACSELHHLQVMCSRYCHIHPQQDNSAILHSFYKVGVDLTTEMLIRSSPLHCSSPATASEQDLKVMKMMKKQSIPSDKLPAMAMTKQSMGQKQISSVVHCALSGCRKPAVALNIINSGKDSSVYDFKWCSQEHYLNWLMNFSSLLSHGQLCRLRGCSRHVNVAVQQDTNDRFIFKAEHFCAWKHHQKYFMMQRIPATSVTLLSGLQHQNSLITSGTPTVTQVERQFESLSQYLSGSRTDIRIYEDFFRNHPWDIITTPGQSLLIARCCWSYRKQAIADGRSKKRSRSLVTKDGFHWKQQGPKYFPACGRRKNIMCRYLTYYRRRLPENPNPNLNTDSSNLSCASGSFRMIEFTVALDSASKKWPLELQDFCVVQLRRMDDVAQVNPGAITESHCGDIAERLTNQINNTPANSASPLPCSYGDDLGFTVRGSYDNHARTETIIEEEEEDLQKLDLSNDLDLEDLDQFWT